MINYPLNILKQVRVILPALCKTPARKSQTLVYQEKSVAPEDTYVDVCKNAHLRYIVETGAKKNLFSLFLFFYLLIDPVDPNHSPSI